MRLWQDERGAFHRYLSRQLSTADAEDVLQDAMVALLEGLRRGSFDWKANLAAYAHGIVRNKANRLRRSFWHQLCYFRAAPPTAVDDVEHADSQPHWSAMDLDDVLRSLDRRARAVLDLRLRGKRYREVAALVGVSESHAAQIHRRAVLRIRRHLELHD